MSIDVNRINELARKARTEGLTDEEKAEQAALRRAYIDSVKDNLRAQLAGTYVQKEDGSVVKLTAVADSESSANDDKKYADASA